ncbi:hypothetical protein TPL01_33420 [Sulfuriferula plumbiphila]|uniref:Uncharacterized protein n=1 Tax=Sulfuriferula plumbiphila TaxID=171865 RepID=A0A512LCI8_9PROT|nr:hypothetical protein SFPGR_28090 [Sulfuriferula plumbiphila]GEP32204.1 hypothetical protein TPL01_33420 [Sulfuriferula plumbiphila]
MIGDIDLNAPFWIQFLPMYFLGSRADEEIINTAALLEAFQASGGGCQPLPPLTWTCWLEGV